MEINVIFEYTNLKTLDSILFYIIIAGLNLLIYGFANNNIASSANKNSSIAFSLGLLGPIGTIICLFQYIKPSWKKVFFGFGRFCFWAIGMQILGEIGIVEEDTKGLLLLFIGFPFILRGKNMFNYSIKKQLDINKNIEPIKSEKDISDNTKSIELNPNNADAYFNRGYSKADLKDHYGAISDYTKVIEVNPNYADAYKNRGVSKEKLGDLIGACADWKKAAELGDTDAAGWVANECN